MTLLTLKEAEAQGVQRVRKPIWVNPLCHLLIGPGIWLYLFDPFNQECNGRDPLGILKFQEGVDLPQWEPYNGPTADSEDYKAAAAQYAGCLATTSTTGPDKGKA